MCAVILLFPYRPMFCHVRHEISLQPSPPILTLLQNATSFQAVKRHLAANNHLVANKSSTVGLPSLSSSGHAPSLSYRDCTQVERVANKRVAEWSISECFFPGCVHSSNHAVSYAVAAASITQPDLKSARPDNKLLIPCSFHTSPSPSSPRLPSFRPPQWTS